MNDRSEVVDQIVDSLKVVVIELDKICSKLTDAEDRGFKGES